MRQGTPYLIAGLACLLPWAVGAGPETVADATTSSAARHVAAPPPIDQSVLLSYLAGSADFVLVDARTPAEFEIGHILRAVNVPHDRVDEFADRLPADFAAPLVVYCKTGRRSAALQSALETRGYSDVRILGPSQIVWSDTAPMFNCGVPTPEPSFVPAMPE